MRDDFLVVKFEYPLYFDVLNTILKRKGWVPKTTHFDKTNIKDEGFLTLTQENTYIFSAVHPTYVETMSFPEEYSPIMANIERATVSKGDFINFGGIINVVDSVETQGFRLKDGNWINRNSGWTKADQFGHREYLFQKAKKEGFVRGARYFYEGMDCKIGEVVYVTPEECDPDSPHSSLVAEYGTNLGAPFLAIQNPGTPLYSNIPLDLIKLHPSLTFGGEPVTVRTGKSGDMCLIECNGQIGTLEELIAIRDHISGLFAHSFGGKSLLTIQSGDSAITSAKPITRLKIGCTTGTTKEVDDIIRYAKILLKKD